jgi:hypothetical protein
VSTSISLGQLQAELAKLHNTVLPQFADDVLAALAREVYMEAVRINPVGTFPTTSDHPGKSRASHRLSSGSPERAGLADAAAYPVPGITEILPALAGVDAREPVFVTNDATTDGAGYSYFPFLEAGSSPQAPDGVYGPAVAHAEGRFSAILRDALTAVLARHGYG